VERFYTACAGGLPIVREEDWPTLGVWLGFWRWDRLGGGVGVAREGRWGRRHHWDGGQDARVTRPPPTANREIGDPRVDVPESVRMSLPSLTLRVPLGEATRAGAATRAALESEPVEKDGISLVLGATKDTFSAGDPAKFTVKITNVSKTDMTLPTSSSYGFFRLEDVKTGQVYTANGP
jgi:hypothetical protein